MYCMNLKDMLKEHQHLVEVLRNGTAAARAKEAAKQEAEAKRAMSRPSAMCSMERHPKHKRGMEAHPYMHEEF